MEKITKNASIYNFGRIHRFKIFKCYCDGENCPIKGLAACCV